MATLTTSWQNIASYTWTLSGYGTKVTFYLDAKYSSQSIVNNTTDIQTRLNCVLNSGSVSGSGYNFTCSYAPTVSGSGVWNFETETITSGSGTITHNGDGTKSLTLSATASNSYWGLNASMSANVSLPTIPRQANLTSAQDFNDEGNPTITYNNNAGNSVSSLQACIANTAGSVIYAPYRDVNKTGTLNYTFNLTNTERNALRQACTGKTMAIKFYLRTIIGGNTFYSTIQKTLTIVNGEPDLSYTIKDTNQEVIEKLGTDTVLIKNISSPRVVLTATPKKLASISSYLINLNGYSVNQNDYTFGRLTGDSLRIGATDSRGFEKYENEIINIINYFEPSATVSVTRAQKDNNNAYLNMNGTWFNGIFADGTEESLQVGKNLSNSILKLDFSGLTFSAVQNAGITAEGTIIAQSDNGYALNLYLLQGTRASVPKQAGIEILWIDGETKYWVDTLWMVLEDETVDTSLTEYDLTDGFGDLQEERPESFGTLTTVDTNNLAYSTIKFEKDVRNTLKITFDYRESDVSNWTYGGEITPTINNNTFETENYLLGNQFSYIKEYKVRINISDLFESKSYITTRQRNDYTLKDTYYESDILTYEDMNSIEDYIYETYLLLNEKMGTSYSYTKQLWYKNSALLVPKLNHIEEGIEDLTEYYYKPTDWQETKTWNTSKPEKFDYTDVNRWINDLNILTNLLYNQPKSLFPSDTLLPSNDLYPR